MQILQREIFCITPPSTSRAFSRTLLHRPNKHLFGTEDGRPHGTHWGKTVLSPSCLSPKVLEVDAAGSKPSDVLPKARIYFDDFNVLHVVVAPRFGLAEDSVTLCHKSLLLSEVFLANRIFSPATDLALEVNQEEVGHV
jgi:hypothetical protein